MSKTKSIPYELLRRSTRVKKETIDLLEIETKHHTSLGPVEEPKDNYLNKEEKISISNLSAQGFLDVDKDELDLERTLLGGQSFRWTKSSDHTSGDPIFTGIVLDNVLRVWRVSATQIAFTKLNSNSEDIKGSKTLLEDYFQLQYPLKVLYKEWSSRDNHLSKCCQQYRGFRILRQDPVENVFSFICATNNNIKRISQMIDKLCKRFGEILPTKGESSIYDSCYTFPSVERLVEPNVFDCLRYQLGFGYRAKFITETASQLLELARSASMTPRDYLLSLRQLPYKETCKQLMGLKGIGRKVADCICLMSMDHLGSVPIDCHIYEIVCRHYMPRLKDERKSLTDKVHDLIASYFNELHGPLAGWSTSILFIGELSHLKIKPGTKPIDEVPTTSRQPVKRKSTSHIVGPKGKSKARK